MRRLIAAFCLVMLSACGSETTTPPSPVDTEITLRLNQPAVVRSLSLTITFEAVVADSRCPINATCLQAGWAVVRVVIDGDRRQSYDLQTPGPSVQHDGVTIEAGYLDPTPFAGHPTDPSEYRLKLRLKR